MPNMLDLLGRQMKKQPCRNVRPVPSFPSRPVTLDELTGASQMGGLEQCRISGVVIGAGIGSNGGQRAGVCWGVR